MSDRNFFSPYHGGVWLLDLAISDDALAYRNSWYSQKLRRFEKNKLPFKCDCAACKRHFECRSIKEYVDRRGYCWGCGFENKIKLAAGTLHNLVRAIPRAERDREEIYPD